MTRCGLHFPSVPGAVPLDSIQASAYEEKIILKWREPTQTYGVITQYEVRDKDQQHRHPHIHAYTYGHTAPNENQVFCLRVHMFFVGRHDISLGKSSISTLKLQCTNDSLKDTESDSLCFNTSHTYRTNPLNLRSGDVHLISIRLC